MDDDVERRVAEVLADPRGHPLDGEVSLLLVALVLAHVGRHFFHRIKGGVEGIDPLELELAAVAELHRLVHFPALEQLGEDAQRRRPTPDADGRPGLGERLGDGEPEPTVVGDSGNEGALAGQID